MNMISTAFPTEMDASSNQDKLVSKLVGAWEKKNSKAARAGGLSLMALSLAACGAEDETAFTQADIDAAVAAVDITSDNAGVIATAVAAVDLTTDNAAAVATAVAAVDLTTDNAAAIATAVAAVDLTTDNAAVIATAVAAVDLTTDNAAAVTLALKEAAVAAGVTGTENMTLDSQIILAIKTADNAGLADAAVAALNISGVTTLAGLNTAYDALANPTVTTFAATTGVDTLVGTASADTFNAGLSAANLTMNSLDTVDGLGGADVLNISLNGSVTPGVIQNVETVNVTVSGTATLNLANATGITSIKDVGSTAVGTYSNVEAASVALTVADNAVGANFSYKSGALTGASDTVNLTLSNATGGNTVSTVLTGAIETVNLTSSSSANSVRLDSDATTLNISGSADLTLGAASTIMDQTTVVNAADATGDVTLAHNSTTASEAVTITGGSGADAFTLTGTQSATDTVSGGAGNDTITFSADLDDVDTVDGGDGTDTLVAIRADMVGLTAAANVTNFEALNVSNSHTVGTLTTATVQAGIDTVTLAGGSNNGTVTFEAGSKTLAITAASTTAVTVNDTGLAVDDSLAITTSNTIDTLAGIATTVNGFETVSLDTGTATAKTSGTITINGDPDSAGVNTAATLTLTGAANLTVTGAVTVGAATATGTIDASAMTGAYVATTAVVGATILKGGSGADTFTAATATASTITGGAGIDTLTGSTAADNISGDAGADILHGSGGADVINGNAGIDTFRMDDAQLLATATLNGGDGVDILLIEDLSAVADAQMTLVSSVETLTSAATGLSATLGAEAMEAGISTVTFVGTNNAGVIDLVTVAKEFTSALTVNLDTLDLTNTEDNQFNAGASVSAVNFVADVATDITGAASASDLLLTGGTTANDKLTTVGGTYVAADLVSVTGVETFIVSNDASASFTISDNNTTATQSLTVDGRAIINTANTFTVVGTAENDGVITVHGSAGADAITGTVTATLGDTINGYGGADVITVAVDAMQTADLIDGGTGSDTLRISGVGTLVDADLTGVTTIEKFAHIGTSTLTTLGTQYMESGSVDITLGAVTNALNLDAITNNQTLNLVAGTDTVDASAMTGALNVKLAEASLTTADTLTGGTGTADTLTITYTGGIANVAGDFDNVTGFEKIVAATNVAGGLAILDAMTAAASSLELDFTAMSSTAATVDLALESNAGITLNTAGGGDTITMSISSVGDTINAGSGTDGINAAIAQLTSADTVDGGAGTDTLTFTDAGSVGDTDFTNVTNIEALTLANGTNTIVLGAEYAGSGSVTITTDAGADSVTLGAGVNTAQTVALVAGDDTFVATGATGVITATITDANLDLNDTLTGGSGSDILTVTGSGTSVTAANMVGVTSFETIKVGSNAAFDLLLNDANTVSGVITVDAALATTAAVTFSGKAENDGTIVYTGGGGVDTVIGTDTTATGDTIGGGGGADVITGGSGGDTITGGAGADVFHYLATADSTGTAKDSITDYTSATDFISVVINNSTNTSGQTYDAVIQTAAAGTSAVQAGMSGSIGQTFFDTTNNTLVVNANADNLVTTLDYQIGLNAASTAANTVVAGDVRFVITGGSGVDTIVTGGGTDTITGGLSADNITGGAGADNFVFTSGLTTDTITDFVTATDTLQISVSSFETAGASIASTTLDLVELQNASATAALDTIVIQEVADQSAGGAVAAAAGANVFVLLAETYASVGDMVDGLETGDHELTTAAAVAVDDAFMAVWSDGTNSYLSIVSVDSGGTADFASGELVGQNLAILDANAVIATGEYVVADFAFIA